MACVRRQNSVSCAAMTKLHTRLLSLAGVLAGASLATGCFTPANYGADHGAAEEHGGAAEQVDEPAAAPEGEGEKIVEGIVPGTERRKLDIKAPEIAYDPPFDGKPLSSKELPDGTLIEEFVLGTEGEAIAENTLVEFSFKGFSGINARQIMGSRMAPAKIVVNDATRKRDPISAALVDAIMGMKTGGKRRVKVPASVVEADAPAGRPPIGDLWLAIEIVSVGEAPVLAGAEAFSGEPVSSKKLDNGLEIYEYAAGEGRAAKTGDQVVTHYIGQLTDGTEFDSSHGRAEGLAVNLGSPGVIPGFAQGLEGAKVGMLRKVVIPPELGYGEREQGKIPANSTLVFLLQITEVSEGTPPPPGMPGMGAPPPRPPKPAAKPAKPAEPADGE